MITRIEIISHFKQIDDSYINCNKAMSQTMILQPSQKKVQISTPPIKQCQALPTPGQAEKWGLVGIANARWQLQMLDDKFPNYQITNPLLIIPEITS